MKFFLIVIVMFFVGCAGQNCFKVGGDYQGINGNIEYCYSPKDSESEKTPTFDSATGKGYIVTEAQISEAVKAMEASKASISVVPNGLQLPESLIQKFNRLTKKN